MIPTWIKLKSIFSPAAASGGKGYSGHSSGFTLIELIVVIALISIMLVFSIPRLQSNPFLDDTKKSSRWIIGKVQALRENAIRNQKRYTLHFDLDTGRIWDTDESLAAEAAENAALDAYTLPESLQIVDIEYPIAGQVSSGRADVTFYKEGYTDKVMIHMADGEQNMSLLIEPFLATVKIFEKYAGFED
jgi:prepilin-type N-terminal cleavage/methylation domain-containing protein